MLTYSSREQILSFLDRVAQRYPAGIPKSSVSTFQAPNYRCALLCIGAEERLCDHMSALAQAICTKGLRLSADECVIRSVPTPFDVEGHLPSLVSELRASHVIICGGTTSPGVLQTVLGVEVLHSYQLEQVAADASIKRQFWEHLQLIIPRIHGKDT